MEIKKIATRKLSDEVISKISEDSVMEGMRRCEEETVIKVLTQFLGRIPTEDDFKRCQKFTYENVFDSYEFAYDGRKLGTVKYNFGNSNPFDPQPKMAVEFTPSSSE